MNRYVFISLTVITCLRCVTVYAQDNNTYYDYDDSFYSSEEMEDFAKYEQATAPNPKYSGKYDSDYDDETVYRMANDIHDEQVELYLQADSSEKREFDETFYSCLAQEKMEQDINSSLSPDMQAMMLMGAIATMGANMPQRTRECQCIFNAAQKYLGNEYTQAMNAFNQGRIGTFKKIFRRAKPAAFNACY